LALSLRVLFVLLNRSFVLNCGRLACLWSFSFSFWWSCGRVGGGSGGELKNGRKGALVPLQSRAKIFQLPIFLIWKEKLAETLDNYFIDMIIYR
jgi:hypothetical protein